MKINKPIAGNTIRNTDLHPSMTSVVIVATDEGAGLLDWQSKLDFQDWPSLLEQSTRWEILQNNEWIPMFPDHFDN